MWGVYMTISYLVAWWVQLSSLICLCWFISRHPFNSDSARGGCKVTLCVTDLYFLFFCCSNVTASKKILWYFLGWSKYIFGFTTYQIFLDQMLLMEITFQFLALLYTGKNWKGTLNDWMCVWNAMLKNSQCSIFPTLNMLCIITIKYKRCVVIDKLVQ